MNASEESLRLGLAGCIGIHQRSGMGEGTGKGGQDSRHGMSKDLVY